MKVVINKCYGGFSLSHAATMAYAKRKGLDLLAFIYDRDFKTGKVVYTPYDPARHRDPLLIFYSTTDLSTQDLFSDQDLFSNRDIPRNDPDLIAIVEEMGEAANGDYAELRIIEIPDDVKWQIDEYDGLEWVSEQHRTWC